ncbi:MAG: phosphoribosylanthranilate isomerase [Gammaproteobacteria bacterium]|nr:MAG: phosphoribosylanthranilate isomerase [Gammaproteobacteria bacterium]
MIHTRIKICGITRPEDAQAAVANGADAIGLVFYGESPRAVTIEQAQRIVAAVPPFVSVVALFVDELADEITRILGSVQIDLMQFHGDESPRFCQQFARPWVKALRVRPETNLEAACHTYHNARGVLLDNWQEGVPGGTGKAFDWQLAADELPLPVVLAGGLHGDNVGSAIARVRPAAVDVSGGVELSPGIKDAEKIRRFITAVRTADQLLDGLTDG